MRRKHMPSAEKKPPFIGNYFNNPQNSMGIKKQNGGRVYFLSKTFLKKGCFLADTI